MDRERRPDGTQEARHSEAPSASGANSDDVLGRLQAELSKARAACRERTELLFSTSHELRTPLNGIVGFADLLLAGEPDELRRDYLDTIRASAVDLLGTINDLLDVARLEKGSLKLDNRAFDVREQIEDSLSLVSPQAGAKDLDLVAYVRPNVPRVLQGDPHRLRQVLLNLLGNAVKYTARGSVTTCVSAQSRDAGQIELRIEISDTGRGLSPTYRQHASQAPVPTQVHEPESAGLGLWISRELVGLMRGRIGVQSRTGRGSRFWFTLPFGVPERQPAPLPRFSSPARVLVHEPHPVLLRSLCHLLRSWGLRPVAAGSRRTLQRLAAGDPKLAGASIALLSVSAQALSSKREREALTLLARHTAGPVVMLATADAATLEGLRIAGVTACLNKPIRSRGLHRILGRLLGEAPAGRERPAASPAAPASRAKTEQAAGPAPAHVLLVEDDPVSRKLVCELLKQRPVQVSVADNGPDAVALAVEQRIDLVLMDIHLPGLDGMSVTRHIRASGAAGREVPIIGLTADVVAEHRPAFLQAGIRECLYKPLDIGRFWKVVDGILAGTAGYTGSGKALETPPAAAADSLMQMLLEELPARRREIVSTLSGNDLRGLANAAHALAGAASYCGEDRLKDAAQRVVREARSQERRQLAAALAALVAAIDELLMQQSSAGGRRGPG